MNGILWHTDPIVVDGRTVKRIGGKAAGLHELQGLGLAVPRWATLATDLFKRLAEEDQELKARLGAGLKSSQDKASAIRDYISRMKIPPEVEAALGEVWEKLSDSGRFPLAVRSSAADEDSATLSFAGQMDSFLNVRSREALFQAVRSCWASLFGDRAVLYREKNGLDPWLPHIAVVVQEMIPAEVSGVVFTANTLTGNREETVVTSVWGLGEGLVSGALDADTFILDREGRVKSRQIADKQQVVGYAQEGGTAFGEAEAGKRALPTLGEQELKELHDFARRIAEHKGRPMDIEFARTGGKTYILQARPITTLREAPAARRDNFKIWDNSNIVESYAGVTTPLTFTFIRKAYAAVYRQFCEVLGVDRKTILRNGDLYENMLGLLYGRVYYNLLNWYRLITLLPGYQYNKRFMEQMMGVQQSAEYAPREAPRGWLERTFVHLPRTLIVGFRMVLTLLALRRRIDRFHRRFRAIYDRYAGLDYSRVTPAEMLATVRTLEREVLGNWKEPILNDLKAMIFYGVLKNLTSSWSVDESGILHNDLIAGEGGIRSTRVVTDLCDIARTIEQDRVIREGFLKSSPEEILARLGKDPAWDRIRQAFHRYLTDYGVRSIEEMKLESVPIKDDPRFCISRIQNYLRQPVPDSKGQREKELEIRKAAERKLAERLQGKRVMVVLPKLGVYRWVLRHAREAIKNRENQRFARAEIYSLVRTIVRALGSQWVQRGLIDQTEDIFYLEWEEIWSYIEGRASCSDLKGLVCVRRAEFEHYQGLNPPDRIETYGEACAGLPEIGEAQVPEMGELLKGLGCCAGVVEREVKVVLKPDRDLELSGEIMVARQTDPGWVVLFPSISGLIVEKGSMLSHSAIVAREMGIPAIVGVKNATQILASGDRVRLDGAAGTIEVLQRAGAG